MLVLKEEITLKCAKKLENLSPIFAFKFPAHRHFGFCDVVRLPLLSRGSFV